MIARISEWHNEGVAEAAKRAAGARSMGGLKEPIRTSRAVPIVDAARKPKMSVTSTTLATDATHNIRSAAKPLL